MRDKALVVMAKAPVAGEVKTRLVPPFSYEQAAELYACLLADQLNSLRSCHGVDRFVAYTPTGSRDIFDELTPEEFAKFAQRGRDLGERMNEAFQDMFAKNYVNVVLIGSDLPALPQEFVERAFATLQDGKTDVVLGPNRDGGYYLIGLRQAVPEIFNNIVWGSDDVLAATLVRIRTLRLTVSLLPVWFDIDTAADLAYLEAKACELDTNLISKTLQWIRAQNPVRVH